MENVAYKRTADIANSVLYETQEAGHSFKPLLIKRTSGYYINLLREKVVYYPALRQRNKALIFQNKQLNKSQRGFYIIDLEP